MHILLTIAILLQLDSAIMERPNYIAAHEQQIASYKHIYSEAKGVNRLDCAMRIQQLYQSFDNDSSLYWAQLSEQLAKNTGETEQIQRCRIAIAKARAVAGDYDNALQILAQVQDSITPSLELDYYQAYSLVYIWQYNFSTIPEVRDTAFQHIKPLRQAIMERETRTIQKSQESALLLQERAPHKAIYTLLPVIDNLPDESDAIRFLANSVGSCYNTLYQQEQKEQWQDSALYYYALSAICDMKHAVREHASLREVARILYQRGDIERAYLYMNTCIEDAEKSKSRLRTIEMASDMPLILQTYRQAIQEQRNSQKRLNISLMVAILALAILIGALIIILVRWNRINNELLTLNAEMTKINAELHQVNASLQDSNRIRDTYVTRYMTECSAIIETMTRYHKTLLRTALSDHPKELFQLVKSTDIIDHTLHDFYQRFDETFLSLFPDFVTDLNTHLRADAAFPLPERQHLSTELRICALIRLGITDSESIARFLRLSVKTVFNYRTLTRNRAITNRDDLDATIGHLQGK